MVFNVPDMREERSQHDSNGFLQERLFRADLEPNNLLPVSVQRAKH